MSARDSEIVFDPFQAGRDANPYPIYERLREEAPVYYSAEYDFFAVSRFDDVQEVSRDWERFSNAEGVDIDRTGDSFGPNFLDSDPPRHRLIRSLLQRRFAPQTVREALEPVIREQVAELAEAVVDKGEADLAEEFAWLLPIAISCHLLGFPLSDRDWLAERSRRFMEREYGKTSLPSDAQQAADEMRNYVTEVVAERRRNPGDDLVSLLALAEVDGEAMPEPELIANAWLLFDAGVHTTACLLTSAFILFDAYQEQREWLLDHPGNIAQAVEELLRFESPLQHLIRTTTTEVEMHGVQIPPGSRVALLYGAANRDPRKWPDPERLDFAREPQRHLAFGEGIHHCMGAPVARLEAAIALERLLPHMREFRLTATPARLTSHLMRGYVSVPAAFS